MNRPKLIARRKNGEVVNPGDFVTDFRGEQRTFGAATRPNTPNGPDGKVLVGGFEYYAGGFGLTVEVEGEKPC